ncbi:hypothetical protein [Spirilliplanes yamanashiensis]|uniref:Uncharacterized protein n=1 Tax=Spirilliplanes yamanashiensis TaxID=42233 RepID=A0A8J3YDS8_9ACTN|nr:hypothetical protein [Spirilliplanes yamanashiensis]MDP9816363.1 hypothetical protein [Spirilliplanes yamanashiensis]GIJ05890.1 hypothetical protein Sya03_52420 [Spirilliplanes yamanashiensis]
MSRTDKTRPWWVRMAETPMVTCVPLHDHRFGPCTLPAEITADGAASPGRCRWVGTTVLVLHHAPRTREWTFQRRDDRRRDRHETRRDLRTWHDED